MVPIVGNRLHKVKQIVRRLARNRSAAVFAIGLLSFAISIVASLTLWPVPSIHDEFSYLLMADTFAEGRLTNPTHAAWESLESFHIIQQPTYASKYPVAQGLVLAFGQVCFGHPIVGVWLSTAFACAAVCWMLLGWVSPRWALLGGVLFTMQEGVQFAWGQSFWGGSVAVAGGALLFGAAPRLLKQITVRHSACLAAGLIILANSRPFEGLIVSLLVAMWLLGTWLKRHELFRMDLLTRFVVPVGCCLMLAGLAMGYYNVRVTGNPLKMPYKVHEQTYSIASVFDWGEQKQAPEYRHVVMHEFYHGYGLEKRREQTTLATRIQGKEELVRFYATTAVAIPLLLVPLLLRRTSVWLPSTILLVLFVSTLFVYASHPHYCAPAAPLLTLLAVEGMRYLKFQARKRRVALGWIVPMIVLLHVAAFANAAWEYRSSWPSFGVERARIERQLEQTEGQHLVMVRYAPDHCAHDEWVYNRADLDAAKVVWAREMDSDGNARTLVTFPGRKVWILEADKLPRRLVTFGKGTSSSVRTGGEADEKLPPNGDAL